MTAAPHLASRVARDRRHGAAQPSVASRPRSRGVRGARRRRVGAAECDGFFEHGFRKRAFGVDARIVASPWTPERRFAFVVVVDERLRRGSGVGRAARVRRRARGVRGTERSSGGAVGTLEKGGGGKGERHSEWRVRKSETRQRRRAGARDGDGDVVELSARRHELVRRRRRVGSPPRSVHELLIYHRRRERGASGGGCL